MATASPLPSSGAPRLSVLRGRPRWVPPALAGILALAALLYTWNIGYSGLSTYYAAAARSMSGSWHALAFGALDPAATTTLDKLSGFLVPQALFIRLFGFHAWALSLPQAIEGVVTVLASYLIGTRWRDHVVGLATATVMALTPMLAAMFGRPMEDGLLTMTMVLAFAAWQRAVLSGRLGWLMLAGGWVAVGFQAKMLQAWLILPALAIGYLLAVRSPLRTRALRIAIGGVVTLVLSLGWITAMQLVPAADRPYVDGSTNDNAYSMVFGYNGLDRILPGAIPGAVPQLDATARPGQTASGQTANGTTARNTTATSDAGHSAAKLILPQFTTQIGWLYPATLAGTLLGLAPIIRRRREGEHPADRVNRATLVTLVLWTGLTGLVLSDAFVPHATYFAVIALPLALLAVSGAFEFVRMYRREDARSRMPLVALVAAQAIWSTVVILTGPAAFHWVATPVLVLGAAAEAGLLIAWGRRDRSALIRSAIVVAAACAMLGPVIWSASVIEPGGGGSASDAYAGPRPGSTGRRAIAIPSVRTQALRAPFTAPAPPHLSLAQKRLVRYINPRNHGRKWLFATDTMAVAVSFALYSKYETMPMGGFSRQAPDPRLDRLRGDIIHSRLRFVLLSSASTPAPPNPALAADRSWVIAHCLGELSGSFRDGSPTRQTLYDCAAPKSPRGQQAQGAASQNRTDGLLITRLSAQVRSLAKGTH